MTPFGPPDKQSQNLPSGAWCARVIEAREGRRRQRKGAGNRAAKWERRPLAAQPTDVMTNSIRIHFSSPNDQDEPRAERVGSGGWFGSFLHKTLSGVSIWSRADLNAASVVLLSGSAG